MQDPTRYWKRFAGQPFNNKYWLRDFLGAGTFGGVFLADEVIADRVVRQVAIKVFPLDAANLERQIAELQLATTLKHPHLLDCYSPEQGSLDGDDCLGLTMEIAAGTLEDRIYEGEIPESEVRAIAHHLASALAFLHGKTITHRDLKPTNVLRVGDVWKISDLGIARMITQGTSTHTSPSQQTGTYIYMPPESYSGEIRPAWDVWSLGILLQELLTSTYPFPHQTAPELMMKVLNAAPEYPDTVPDAFRPILDGCFAKDPHQRWTAQQVLDALTPKVSPDREGVDGLRLESERGVDYRRLQELLAAGNWKEADLETAHRMLEAMGRKQSGWIRAEELETFPCKDLRTIDRLWVHYSGGKFGFSVQKKIWQDCGRPTSYRGKKWHRFCVKVGWQTPDERAYGHNNLRFNLEKSPVGELPYPYLKLQGPGGVFSSLAQRLVKCSTSQS